MKSNEKNKHGRVVHIDAHRNVAASTKGGQTEVFFLCGQTGWEAT